MLTRPTLNIRQHQTNATLLHPFLHHRHNDARILMMRPNLCVSEVYGLLQICVLTVSTAWMTGSGVVDCSRYSLALHPAPTTRAVRLISL